MADDVQNRELAAMAKLDEGLHDFTRLSKNERDHVKDWARRAHKVELDSSRLDAEDERYQSGAYL